MRFRHCVLLFCSLINAFGLVNTLTHPSLAQVSASGCPTSALERFERHKVAPGETLETIAQHYNLNLATIIALNPTLQNRRITVGSEIQIPPYNGIIVQVPQGQTWRQVGLKYKIRPSVLFEANGCQKNPSIVFIPIISRSPNRRIAESPTQQLPNSLATEQGATPSLSKLAGYPLPKVVKIALPYGWQKNPKTGEVFFHSGLNLLAAKGTPVQAISDGRVAFAGEKGTYGKLVIINHSGGLQSRYAQLDSIKVSTGQQVKKGDLVGTVGTTGTLILNQPYLHFEVRSSSDLGWVAQDPKIYLQQQTREIEFSTP
ncbi:MAG: M23 family metallopeptidase [Rhizonema sp. PD37]|nr:M23 family metallopeptidase [Rhizonema sp. PD37]